MVIELSHVAFIDTNNFKAISYLLKICSYQNRYFLFTDLSLIDKSEIYSNLDSDSKDVLESYFNRYVERSLTTDLLIDPTDGSKMNLEEAIKYLSPPFLVLLENSLSDSYFLNSIINNFKKHSKLIRHALESGFLEYANAGGCNNIQNFIEAKSLYFNGQPKDKFSYLRIFVVMDSDKTYPTQVVNDKAKVCKYLISKNIPFHILEKREIENYIPDEIFQVLEHEDNFIQAYLKLTPIQKDHFDIENGFRDVNFNSLDPNIQALYNGLSPADYAIFRKLQINIDILLKYFPEIYEKDGNNYHKQLLPKLFNSVLVEATYLQNRCKHQTNPRELLTILNEISQRL